VPRSQAMAAKKTIIEIDRGVREQLRAIQERRMRETRRNIYPVGEAIAWLIAEVEGYEAIALAEPGQEGRQP
jgi:hypothetical protein